MLSQMTQPEVMPQVQTRLWHHTRQLQRWFEILLTGFLIALEMDQRFARCQETHGMFLGCTHMGKMFLGQV